MKKQFLFFSCLLVSSITFTCAQQVKLGVRGGLNVSTVSGDIVYRYFNWYEYSQKPRIGFNVGVDASSQLSDKISLQVELLYSTEGASASGQWTDSGEGKMTSTQKFDFLAMPMFVKYNFSPHFYFMAGPQVSYLLSSHYKYRDEIGGFTTIENNLKSMNKVGFGLVPSIGYEVDKFSFGIRYFKGFSQLNKSNDDRKLKGTVFSVVVHYRLFHRAD
ncbi:MAG: PorT family protein [Cyclobacteriaceae bacterium]|nr:PorT family protein [Cyclobacteriaceae bacterium]